VTIHLRPHQKGPPPAWVFVGAGLAVCLTLVKAGSLLPVKLLPPCGFHAVTGHPCPTCGATRALLFASEGRMVEAFLTNPFFCVCLALLALWVFAGAVALLARRDLTVELGRRGELWLWLVLGTGFLANWAYLWCAGI
jgi:hypothetical protein